MNYLTSQDLDRIPAMEISDIAADVHPLVSVLMITMEHEAYIPQAIESILAQKCDFPIELIVGEDCSQDRTRDICLDYQRRFPEKIRLVVSDENVGMHNNLFRIWSRARGKYLAMCDGDDYWKDENKLTKQVALMEQHPDYSMCGTYAERITPGEGASWMKTGEIRPASIKDTYGIQDLIPDYTFHFSSILLKKECVEFPRWFADMYCGDRTIYLLCAEKGPVGLIPEVTSVYRMHEGGVWVPVDQLNKAQKGIVLFEHLDRYFGYKYKGIIRQTLGTIIWSYMAESLDANDLVAAKKLFRRSFGYQFPKINMSKWRDMCVVMFRLYFPSFYSRFKRRSEPDKGSP